MLQVSGMRIYTSEEVEAVNGTDVRLRCTFESSSPIKPDDVVITWSFRPLKGGPRQSVSVCVSVNVCVSVSLQRQKKSENKPQNLPHCVKEHPPPHPSKRGTGESSGSLWSIQDSQCLYTCVWGY